MEDTNPYCKYKELIWFCKAILKGGRTVAYQTIFLSLQIVVISKINSTTTVFYCKASSFKLLATRVCISMVKYLTMIGIMFFIYCQPTSSDKKNLGSVDELGSIFKSAHKFTITIPYVRAFKETKRTNDLIDFPDSVEVSIEDFKVIQYIRSISDNIFKISFSTDPFSKEVETLEINSVNYYNKLGDKIDREGYGQRGNVRIYKKIDEILSEPTHNGNHQRGLNCLRQLKNLSIVCPDIDHIQMERFVLPKFLNYLRTLSLNSLLFKEIIIPAESNIKHIIMRNDAHNPTDWEGYDSINQISTFDLHDLDSLETIEISGYKIGKMNLRNLNNLKELILMYYQISELTIENAANLRKIDNSRALAMTIHSIALKRLDSLEELNFTRFYSIDTLYLDKNPNLKKINCAETGLEYISIRDATGIEYVDLSCNSLSGIESDDTFHPKVILLRGNPIKDIETLRARFPKTKIYFTDLEYIEYEKERRVFKRLKDIYGGILFFGRGWRVKWLEGLH